MALCAIDLTHFQHLLTQREYKLKAELRGFTPWPLLDRSFTA